VSCSRIACPSPAAPPRKRQSRSSANLSPHQHGLTLQLIEQTEAAVRFLSAYSPNLNPIEKMWSKVKQFLRSAEARTGEELQKAVWGQNHAIFVRYPGAVGGVPAGLDGCKGWLMRCALSSA
jgi:hypothetical protein